jgi:hypothetical protein
MELSSAIFILYYFTETKMNTETLKINLKHILIKTNMDRIRYEHGRKSDDYRSQETI